MIDQPAPAADAKETAPRRLILVEDDAAVRRSLQLLLAWRGYDVRSYSSAAAAVSHLAEDQGSDLLVADYRLPDGDGIGLLRALRRSGWHGRAILITAFPSPMLIDSALASGFDAVLEKPLRQHELVGALAG